MAVLCARDNSSVREARALDLRWQALAALQERDPQRKVAAVATLWQHRDRYWIDASHRPQRRLREPGRPSAPVLVSPRELPRRSLRHAAGQVALYHALAHIEFNAINLALDAVYRFGGMPEQYYIDWLQVAFEESTHFELLCDCMQALDAHYGALPAHNALWKMTFDTDYSALVRMALVPRVLEARGLDVAPIMIVKLREAGATQGVEALEVILREEVGHVAIGNRWFCHLCAEQSLDPETTFIELLNRHARAALQLPFNLPGRREAGFSERELAALEQLALDFRSQMQSRRSSD